MTTDILDYAKDTLLLAGNDLTETRDLPPGWQFRALSREIVWVYKTGKVIAQGKNAAAVKALCSAFAVPS